MKIIIFFTLFLSNLKVAQAKIIYYGTMPEKISIVFGHTTMLRFDEEVKTISQASQFIIEPADLNDPNYQVFTLKPRDNFSQDQVTFILANDTIVHLMISTISKPTPETKEHFYELRPQIKEVDPLSKEQKGQNITEIELMKSMIRMDTIIGYENKSVIRKLDSGEKQIAAQLTRVYTGPKFNGYIFKITNTSKNIDYAIDVKSLALGKPNMAILSQCDQAILKPKQTTHLRVVSRPSSVYYDITLPISTIEKKLGDLNEANQ